MELNCINNFVIMPKVPVTQFVIELKIVQIEPKPLPKSNAFLMQAKNSVDKQASIFGYYKLMLLVKWQNQVYDSPIEVLKVSP